MTAAELHELGEAGAESYEAGFNLKSKYDGSIQGHVSVLSRFGVIDLVVQASAGRASASACAGLSPGEADELAGALQHAARAARAAENARERTG